METIVDITLPGEPVGKGRARFVRATGRTYTPEKTSSYESMVKGYAYEAMAGRAPVDGPITVEIEAFFQIPKSMTGKQGRTRLHLAEAERLPVVKKPDGDNIAKIVLDPMNTIVFKDDSQAWRISVSKVYSPTPRVRVRVLA